MVWLGLERRMVRAGQICTRLINSVVDDVARCLYSLYCLSLPAST